MAEGHRLRDLQVGEARHHGRGVRFGEIDQRAAQAHEELRDLVDLGAEPEPDVGRDLIVPRARGVQPFTGVAHESGEPPLDVEVHVLRLDRPLEAPGADLVANRGEPPLDLGQVASAEDAAAAEHPSVGERALDVELGEASIE